MMFALSSSRTYAHHDEFWSVIAFAIVFGTVW